MGPNAPHQGGRILKQGDISVSFGRIGVRLRIQTFVDPEFCFRVLVDPSRPILTLRFECPHHAYRRGAGSAMASHPAHLPNDRRRGRVEHSCRGYVGQSTDEVPFDRLVCVRPAPSGVPRAISFDKGNTVCRIEDYVLPVPRNPDRLDVRRSSDCAVEQACRRSMHRPSAVLGDLRTIRETIGQVRSKLHEARGMPPLDIIGHQGNDFR